MAHYSVRGPVAVIELNNPPLNTLSPRLCTDIYDGIEKAASDPNVTGVVLAGKGRAFCAGADINRFSQVKEGQNLSPPGEPRGLIEFGMKTEESLKPVVAAIHGVALGGGLEVAMFCHYRIATSDSRLGQPEVNIGILPAGHGTQRLPRLAGIPVAMEMITTGRHITAQEALQHNIIDKIVSGNIIDAGIEFLRSGRKPPLIERRLSKCSVKKSDNLESDYEAAREKTSKKFKGLMAPLYCLKAVKAAAELPYELGCELESNLMLELVLSGQARALQYAFFSERNASKWILPGKGDFKSFKPRAIHSAAVIGAGTMGSGIVVTLINAGIPVVLVEQNQKFLNSGVVMIHSIIGGSVRLKKMSEAAAKKSLSLLKPSLNYNDIKNVDIVIEAVFENLKLKQTLFEKLDKICKPEAILCSNTSSLDINKIASATKRPEKVAGTHFFAPAYIMKLLENVYGDATSGSTVATIMDLGKKIGKIPVLVKTCDGFLANRIYGKYGSEASFMIEEGALPEDVDRVIEDFGLPMGPFKTSDLSGLDIGVSISTERARAHGVTDMDNARYVNGERLPKISYLLSKKGRLGRKTGKGFYKYEKVGGKEAFVDDEVTGIIEEYCRSNGLERRKIGSQEIFERCLYAMVNEGFKCLEEGIVSRPEDIDVIMINGFAWPRHLGGPMFYASRIGLRSVCDKIHHYYSLYPHSMYWQPSKLLEKLSHTNPPLKSWMDDQPASRL